MVFISVGATNAVATTFGSGDMNAAKRAASVSRKFSVRKVDPGDLDGVSPGGREAGL